MEHHLFGNFIPPKAEYLLLGSFTAKRNNKDQSYDWFYCSKRNQFWPIINQIYNVNLKTTEDKKQFFTRQRIAIADIILKCDRKNNDSSNSNLINIVYNLSINKIFKQYKLKEVFFSSKFAKKIFL